MSPLLILNLLYGGLLVTTVQPASIRYDQSQSGDYNVQIHLKNIELYAILDEGTISADYDYDYTDLTEKPTGANSSIDQPLQQQQTSSTTSVYNDTTLRPHFPSSPFTNPNYNVIQSATNNNNNNNNNNNVSGNSANVVPNLEIPIQDSVLNQRIQYQLPTFDQLQSMQQFQQLQQQQQVPYQNNQNNAVSTADSNLRLTRKCAPGFYKDNLGRCRRIRKPHLPFLQMVHTPGVIKSFQQQQLETNSSTTSKPITEMQ